MEAKLREGERLFQEGRKKEAEAAFREVLERAPGHSRALNNLAVMALTDGRPAEAEDLLAEALARNPEDQAALDSLLKLRLMQQRWLEVKAVAGTILARRPDDGRTLKIAARADLTLEAFAEARAKIDRLLELTPGEPEVLELSALAHLKSGREEEARRELETLLTLNPARADLAARLARLNNPEVRNERDLWPDPTGHSGPVLAGLYRRAWGEVTTSDPVIRAARILGRLDDPASLTEADLPLSPPPPPRTADPAVIPDRPAEVAGLSIMFAPTIIAGQSAMMARWLKARGAKTANVEVSRNYLGYQADYYYPQSPAEVSGFIDLMMKKAEKFDVLCLDFGSSFSYMPNFVSRPDYRREETPGQPYADLLPLKDKGVKIFFQFWGSDHTSQSLGPYVYLTQLGFAGLPKPPAQTRVQYRNVKAADEVADVFLGLDFGMGHLPRVPVWHDVCLEPERWPLKAYRPKLEKILTAPTNPRKKNYSLIQAALRSFLSRRPEVSSFRVQDQPHARVPALYSEADLGIDQVTWGFGTFSVEMMALGLPVICRRPWTGGHRDLAPVLDFRNIRELAARLSECAADPGRLQELGRRGRDYALERHSIETGGRFFSHYLAEAAAGGAVGQIRREEFAACGAIWDEDPEKNYSLRFYDAAVPLFCALGEFEYAVQLCRDALDCGHREDKFTAWFLAVTEVSGLRGFQLSRYRPLPESLPALTENYKKMIKSSKALLEEYASELSQAEALKEGPHVFFPNSFI